MKALKALWKKVTFYFNTTFRNARGGKSQMYIQASANIVCDYSHSHNSKHGIKILIQSQIQIAWKIASKLIFVEFKFHTTYAYKNNWSFHLKDFLAS